MSRPTLRFAANTIWAVLILPLSSNALGAAPLEDEFFEKKIRPVLVEKCYSCHSATKQKGGLRLDSRENIQKGGATGAAAVPGQPDKSLLLRAIRRTNADLMMPPGDVALTADQIRDFAAWIKSGLHFPGPANTGSVAGIDFNAARLYWSFQPPKDVQVEKVKQIEWPAGPIDTFVLAKLEAKGMKPSPPADKRTLLRRATYDLTGLPPTSEEIEAFLADNTPGAYSRVVDRLLASPQYGVKWGRHWLDVARYGDTRWVGAGEDRRWSFAHTYRDWVVRAFNEDVPYDRFVTLQLAADQAPGATAPDQAALGFLTVGRWFTGNIHDVIDDQIDVVTRGLLGLSAQCARCHDHKFDPISTKDYYSLYGLFAASRLPVEGSGLMAQLPAVAPHPLDAATEKELTAFRDTQDRFLAERLKAVRSEYRQPAKMEEYMLAAQGLLAKTDNDVRALAKAKELNEHVLFRWVRYLQRSAKNPHPIFGPWQAFAALPEADFATKAVALADTEKAKKPLNRHVAEILTPAPASLAELARRYTQLFLKFDAPESSPEFEQEAIRQVLQNDDSPVKVSLGELGQHMTKEDRDRVFQMRRELLAKQVRLSPDADTYLVAQTEGAPALAAVNEFLVKRRAAVTVEIRSPSKIADYLMAVRDAKGADDFKFRSIVNSRKLSDRLLRRWVEFLQRRAESADTVFVAWRAFADLPDTEFGARVAKVSAAVRKPGGNRIVAEAFATEPISLRDVATRYGEIIAKYNGATPAADADTEQLRLVSMAPDSPLAFTEDEVLDYFARKDFDELKSHEVRLARVALEHPGITAKAMILRESPRGYAQKVFVRGNSNILGEDAHGRFLTVLADDKSAPFKKDKGRWELARAIVDPKNPLAARVMVNRVWQWHFGAGLVATASDFGTRGESPTHPELLDWLARRFVAESWSVKKLHREIMLSSTYRQSSQDNPAARTVDPENRFLWRASRRRLGFEELRDSLLATAGRLDLTLGGRPVDLTRGGSEKRTIFGTVDRVNLPGLYRDFDFPSADSHAPGRHETIVPQQALFMMNSTFFMDQAARLARRTERAVQTPTERIRALYRLVYGRAPTTEELALGLEFVASEEPAPDGTKQEPAVEPTDDAWRYGYGRFGAKESRVLDFEPLPHFNGQWRGAAQQDTDSPLARCSLNAQGGTIGGAGTPAVVRRWIAPREGTISITGTFASQVNSTQIQGDGHRGRIVSSRTGILGHWLVHGTEEVIEVTGVAVKRGDTIDFIVEGRGRDMNAGANFNWAPVIRMSDGKEPPKASKDAPKGPRTAWEASKDFKGKETKPMVKRATVWERYAQVLLEANEFLFLD